MTQTAYLPLATLGRNFGSYLGGLCQWWYTPIENLDGFPAIDSTTQMLLSEPSLVTGATWYGPVTVPNQTVGFEEVLQRSVAGPYYKRKVVGEIPGNEYPTHIQLGNMVYHQYCIVGKMRAGGYFIILGNNKTGLDFDHSTKTGNGGNGKAENTLAFTDESAVKSLVLPSFAGTNSQGPPTNTITLQVDFMELDFNTSGDTEVLWDASLIARFGNYPLIETWAQDEITGQPYRANLAIDAEGVPPTKFIIRNNGGIGKIRIQ